MPHKTILPNEHADGKGYLVHVAGDVLRPAQTGFREHLEVR